MPIRRLRVILGSQSPAQSRVLPRSTRTPPRVTTGAAAACRAADAAGRVTGTSCGLWRQPAAFQARLLRHGVSFFLQFICHHKCWRARMHGNLGDPSGGRRQAPFRHRKIVCNKHKSPRRISSAERAPVRTRAAAEEGGLLWERRQQDHCRTRRRLHRCLQRTGFVPTTAGVQTKVVWLSPLLYL